MDLTADPIAPVRRVRINVQEPKGVCSEPMVPRPRRLNLLALVAWGLVLVLSAANSGVPATSTSPSIPTAATSGFDTWAPATTIIGSVTISPSADVLAVGGTATFIAEPTCNVNPCPSGITYSWSLSKPTLGTLSSSSSESTDFTAGGSTGLLDLTVNATLDGSSATASAGLQIANTVPVLVSVTISPSTPTIAPTTSKTFTAEPKCSGGASCLSGLSYVWSLSSDEGVLNATSGPVVSVLANSSQGLITVTVVATLNDHTATGTANITVTSSSSDSGGSRLVGDAVVLIVVILLVALVVRYLTLRKHKPRSGSGAPGPMPPAPSQASGTAMVLETPLARPPGPALPTPAPGVPSVTTPSSSAPPAWPMVPFTIVEAPSPDLVYGMAASSGLERERMLVIGPTSPGALAGTYGLAGAVLWRLSQTEGDQNLSPADVDRIGDVITRHLERGSGRAAVIAGLDRVVEASGVRATRRLLEVAHEIAEANRGTFLASLNPEFVKEADLKRLEESAQVLKLR